MLFVNFLGQHLLSAVFENDHKLATTSWWLGEDDSFIELDCASLSNDIITDVENKCNQYIRDSLPVTVKVCSKDDPLLDAVIMFKLLYTNKIIR